MKAYIKIKKKTIIKFVNIKIEKQNNNQYKSPISIKTNIDINKIVVSNKSLSVKTVLDISWVIKMLKLDLYVYFSQK